MEITKELINELYNKSTEVISTKSGGYGSKPVSVEITDDGRILVYWDYATDDVRDYEEITLEELNTPEETLAILKLKREEQLAYEKKKAEEENIMRRRRTYEILKKEFEQ